MLEVVAVIGFQAAFEIFPLERGGAAALNFQASLFRPDVDESAEEVSHSLPTQGRRRNFKKPSVVSHPQTAVLKLIAKPCKSVPRDVREPRASAGWRFEGLEFFEGGHDLRSRRERTYSCLIPAYHRKVAGQSGKKGPRCPEEPLIFADLS